MILICLNHLVLVSQGEHFQLSSILGGMSWGSVWHWSDMVQLSYSSWRGLLVIWWFKHFAGLQHDHRWKQMLSSRPQIRIQVILQQQRSQKWHFYVNCAPEQPVRLCYRPNRCFSIRHGTWLSLQPCPGWVRPSAGRAVACTRSARRAVRDLAALPDAQSIPASRGMSGEGRRPELPSAGRQVG